MGWLPVSDAVYNEFIGDLTGRASNEKYSTQVGLIQPIQEFKAFIESDPVVYQEFITMFEGIEESVSLHFWCTSYLLAHCLSAAQELSRTM